LWEEGHKKRVPRGVTFSGKCLRGVNKSCFVSEEGKENTRFCPGISSPPPPVFLME